MTAPFRGSQGSLSCALGKHLWRDLVSREQSLPVPPWRVLSLCFLEDLGTKPRRDAFLHHFWLLPFR
jgi:hypothetical protein